MAKAVKKCKATAQAYRERREAERTALEKFNRFFTMQQMMDFVLIAAADEFGFGPDRLKRLNERAMQVATEYSTLLLEDVEGDRDFEYTKAVIDRKLKQVCGENFEPWEVRYNFGGVQL